MAEASGEVLLVGGEDAVEVDEEDEAAVDLAHAGEVVELDAGPEGGRGLDVGVAELEDLGDRVGQDAEDGGLAVEAASTMRMQVRRETGVSGRPNLRERSTTGTTEPRRLMTPRTERGTEGTRVTGSYWRISLTCRMPTA